MRLQDFITITLGCQIPWNVHQLPHPNLSTSWIQLLAKRSFRRRYTLALPSPRFNRNRDSSLNQTVLQRCCGHTLCVQTHWSRTWRCRQVKTTALTGRLALIPASRRQLRTVCSEILCCPGIAAAVDVAVVNLSRKWRNRIWWSWAGLSLLVVLTVGGHVLSLAVGTHPKDKRCYSGKHSAPWIHVSGFHLLVTGR
jgi:hypothetical protein